MFELLSEPPPPEAIAKMTAIEGVRIVPTALTTQQGPDGHLGPEAAGAVLILQATFVDKQGAEKFWLRAAGLMGGWLWHLDSSGASASLLDRTSPRSCCGIPRPTRMHSSPAMCTRPQCATSTPNAGSTHTSLRFGR